MFNNLVNQLASYKSAVLGLSGGVDSSLLAFALRESKIEYLTLTVQSELQTSEEIAQSVSFCQQYQIKHQVIKKSVLENHDIKKNDSKRCYYCKHEIFGTLIDVARQQGFENVIEGSHCDDIKKYRPGRQAVIELNVKQPFIELGWSKADIRKVSKELGLPTFDKESSPCLATRIPYGDQLSADKLILVGKSEQILRDFGLVAFRCRVHNNLLRIEAVDPAAAFEISSRCKGELKALGFDFITVDVLGYQEGCFDGKH